MGEFLNHVIHPFDRPRIYGGSIIRNHPKLLKH